MHYCFNNTYKKVEKDRSRKKKKVNRQKKSIIQKKQHFITARWKYNGTFYQHAMLCPPPDFRTLSCPSA